MLLEALMVLPVAVVLTMVLCGILVGLAQEIVRVVWWAILLLLLTILFIILILTVIGCQPQSQQTLKFKVRTVLGACRICRS